ncbi:MAG: STAS domain-containing protein [Nitrospira sp.]|nr:STAS domain-containing protein [Nitrospira sp.]
MEIAVSDVGEIKVVRIEGKLDTQSSPDAQTQLTQLIDQGATKLVVNFEKLDYISSAGLRILLAAAKQLKSNSGELRICGLNEVVQEVFDISGFTTILTVTKTEPEALEGF